MFSVIAGELGPAVPAVGIEIDSTFSFLSYLSFIIPSNSIFELFCLLDHTYKQNSEIYGEVTSICYW